MSEENEIVIPDGGLFSAYPPEAVPRHIGEDGFLHIGWSYARNVSLSRKPGCIKKSLGIEKFSASATGSTDSVRGIGILNKYARPNNFELSQIKSPAAQADDGDVNLTTSTYSDATSPIDVGQSASVQHECVIRFPSFTEIAQSTQIISATLKVKVQTLYGTPTTKIYGDDQQNPGQIADYADYAGRTQSTAYKSYTFNGTGWHLIDVTSVLQELVDSYAANTVFQFFLTDDSNDNGNKAQIYSHEATDSSNYPSFEIITTADIPNHPTYFMYVKGASAGELWKLDSNKTPSEVTQGGESYASSYQSQTAKFLKYGNDMLVTDDGYNDAIQQWDVSDDPSAFEDVVASYNGRYIEEFKARVWLIWSKISGTIYKQRAYYSDVNDQTTFGSYALLPGYDDPTAVIRLTQDELIIFKEGSTVRLVDVIETIGSDYRPYTVSPEDGSLGANVILGGSRIYGINDKGVFQWPVPGYPNGFRYISKPIQDEIDKITLEKMNLVWFAYDRVYNCIHMHYPDTGYSRNTLDAVFNITKDTWENISDIWESNVMVDGFDSDGTPMMFIGQEDGYLKNIGGDDDEGSNFTGRIDTGALWKLDKQNRLISRTLVGIEPVTNYEGSYTLQFRYKVYDRPGDESGTSWSSAYTHASSVRGNEETVPISPGLEGKYHIIRIDGTVKDEAFEIMGLKLRWKLGSPT